MLYRDWVKEKGYSPAELKDLTGWSMTANYNYMAGFQKPSPDRIELIKALSKGAVTEVDHQNAWLAYHGKV